MTSGPMRVVRQSGAVRRQVRLWRGAGERVAFVPTMGYLHDGHLSLVDRARRRAKRVVLSIYVNPTQFAPGEDLSRYPRNVRRDLALARNRGVDLAFLPQDLYHPEHTTRVEVEELGAVLEGASRPTHFAGVALVVLKLLHIVEPDLLVLGQKDAQQAVLLERMIRDLDLAVRVERGRIVREPDGLAMSSRNVYLSPEERTAAPILHRSLVRARAEARRGDPVSRVLDRFRKRLAAEPHAGLDYIAAVDARTLRPLRRFEGRVLLAAAARFGGARLIDNEEFTMPKESV